MRKITSNFLREVEEEPLLPEITGEVFKRDARLDIWARGFSMQGQMVFCDVWVFNPLTKCHHTKTLVPWIIRERIEIRYTARVIEENISFTPLVLSCFDGTSSECSMFFRGLSEMLAETRGLTTNDAICYIHCIRGSRGVREKSCPKLETYVSLVNHTSGAKEWS